MVPAHKKKALGTVDESLPVHRIAAKAQIKELQDNEGRSLYCLTLTVLVATINAQWEGMGDVGSARYEPALLPAYPTIRVLSCSN